MYIECFFEIDKLRPRANASSFFEGFTGAGFGGVGGVDSEEGDEEGVTDCTVEEGTEREVVETVLG